MAWKDDREGLSYDGRVLTLDNGVTISGLDKLGLSDSSERVVCNSYDGKYYITSYTGDETLGTVFTICKDGSYSHFSLKELDRVLVDFVGWDHVWSTPENSVVRNIQWGFDTVGKIHGTPRHLALISSQGMYGDSPRTYYIKGKINPKSCKSSIHLLSVLNSVFTKIFCTEADCPCKYTIAEYEGYFLVSHFVINSLYVADNDITLPRISYKLDKASLSVLGVDLNQSLSSVVNHCSLEEYLLENGFNNKGLYDFNDVLSNTDAYFPKELRKQITLATLKVFEEISNFSNVLRVPVDYFEVTRGIGDLDLGCGFVFGEDLHENTQSNVKIAYIGTSPIRKETGFSADENELQGMLGNNAVVITF